jgi:hypothetical protein|tara:strand:- start:640 stop:2073 length:1434 start_codon:yes stop_codon:yes gene_type:complete
MRFIVSIFFAMILTLTTSAEEITTSNLLPNAGDSKSSAQSVDNNIPNVASSCSEFTVSGATCFSNEIETTGTGTVNATGSLLNITTNSDTTTQDKLDNGVTLNSTTIIQNCEWDGSSNECGDRAGARDTFKTTVKILDANGNTLASVDQIRNTDAHYYANAHKYTDQVIYTGSGSSSFDWTWTGIDNNANPGNLGGPNLLGASLTMTYENVVLEVETQTALQEVSSAVNATEIEEAVSVEIKEETQTLAAKVQTIAATPLPNKTKVVQVKAAIKKFEKKTGAKVVKAQIKSQPTSSSTTNVVQTKKVKEEKKPETIAKQIIQSTTKKEETNEKEEKQEEQKPEKQTEEKQEKKQEKKIVSTKTKTKTTQVSKLDAAMDEVDAVVKDTAKNLEVKNIILLDAMVGDNNLNAYLNQAFYKTKDIYLNQNFIIDNRKIYNEVNLVSYMEKDPIFIKDKILQDINYEKQRLILKLKELKNG